MRGKRQFSEKILAVIRKKKSLRIRAGTGRHRFIRIWAVIVKDRVFVRSWSIKPDGWYREFLKEPRGAIQVGDRKIAVRAVRIRSRILRDAVDHALLETYRTPSLFGYAKDMVTPKCRATTIELVPLAQKS